eukprot:TRINITY_DN13008_c0_g1_i1.p1 TRINITY_DN13008_c0_g1~~TRINITY_DN13008_c0_g1_i1.p1  ORF type:complete len:239 (-),score=41.74 TRINITY_DN13008_c0_g1_i1:34-750(-)
MDESKWTRTTHLDNPCLLNYLIFSHPDCLISSSEKIDQEDSNGGSQDQKQLWPLLVFLHGAGEKGSKIDRITAHGPPRVLTEKGIQNSIPPCICVAPQCPATQFWTTNSVFAMIEEVRSTYPIDSNRIYGTGISMGGFGIFKMIAAYPDLFAAVVPICGGGDTMTASKIKRIPMWIFHSRGDPIVPFKHSKDMVDAIQKQDPKEVKLTIYEDKEHDSWTRTYLNPDVWKWMFSQSKTS